MSKEKEIIIDGVDVSKCKYYSKKQQIYQATRPLCIMKDCCMLSNSTKLCTNNDCYFKQLKRLQEENEKLKEKNKELLNLCNNGGALLVTESAKTKKYKQALEEIRKYCEEQNLKADYTACYITNKIDEVLNDRD